MFSKHYRLRYFCVNPLLLNYKTCATVPFFKPDGLTVTAAEPWFKVKVQLLHTYIQAFMAHAITRTDKIIFIDLFAGSGLYSVGHQKEIFPATCLLSLDDALPFTHRIFWEADAERAHALEQRVRVITKQKSVEIVNKTVTDVVDYCRNVIGKEKGRKPAVLCLVDPFSMEIPFSTIASLTSLGFNFLIPFTFMLNERSNNFEYYCNEHPEKLKRYAGISDLDRFRTITSNFHFYKRLVQIYQNNMLANGLNVALSTQKVESQLMQLPAYYIGFFSRQFSTQAIHKEVRVSDQPQFELF